MKWCMKQTKFTSEVSCPTDSCLAPLAGHETEDPEADRNASDWPIVKNPIMNFKSTKM